MAGQQSSENPNEEVANAPSLASFLLNCDATALKDIITFASKLIEERTMTTQEPSNDAAATSTPTAPAEDNNYKQVDTKTSNRAKRQRVTFMPVFTNRNAYDVLNTEHSEADMHEVPETVEKQDQEINKNENEHRIPPIILRDKDKWNRIHNQLKIKKINFTKATNIKDGISICPQTETDYRNMYKAMEAEKVSFHTYQLRSEKTLKVIMRNIPQHIELEEINNDLIAQKYETTRITRINGRDGRPAPLVQIELDRKFKSIFNLEHCCGLNIKIEAKKIQRGPVQCHKCQIFGHTQPHCHAPYRCMKCAGAHSTHTCEKPTTTPAKCANCAGEHTSNNPRCPMFPKQQQQINRQSYSQITARTASNPNPATPTTTANPATNTSQNDAFAATMGNLLITLYSTNPNPEQITSFITQTKSLYNIYLNKNN